MLSGTGLAGGGSGHSHNPPQEPGEPLQGLKQDKLSQEGTFQVNSRQTEATADFGQKTFPGKWVGAAAAWKGPGDIRAGGGGREGGW